MIKIKPIDIVYASIPAIAGYGVSAICNIGKDAGSSVKFRPPAKAFGIIWAILFPLFGISWAVACRDTANASACVVSYAGATACLALWSYVYGCRENKKGSFVGAGRNGRLSLMVLCPGQLHFAHAAFSVDRMGAFRVVDEHDRGAV